jgi:hypothetical protein
VLLPIFGPLRIILNLLFYPKDKSGNFLRTHIKIYYNKIHYTTQHHTAENNNLQIVVISVREKFSTIQCTESLFPHIKWAGHVARMGETRNAYKIFLGKPEGKRPLGRPRRRWMDNIKMDLREIGWDGVDWMDMAQDRNQWRALVNMVLNLRVP